MSVFTLSRTTRRVCPSLKPSCKVKLRTELRIKRSCKPPGHVDLFFSHQVDSEIRPCYFRGVDSGIRSLGVADG